MTLFSDKLDRLHETVAITVESGAAGLADGLKSGRGLCAIAVGSGGSIVASEFFARGRSSLRLGLTLIMTPMQFVLSESDFAGCEIWLFSAGADNPDIAAAFARSATLPVRVIHLVTVRESGATAKAVRAYPGGRVYVLPVADAKDGFLATHSMTSMIATLLIAFDLVNVRPLGANLTNEFADLVIKALADDSIGSRSVALFRPKDLVIILHDPRLATIASLIETSLWETGIAPVQRTDFRNFAHGRHIWAAKNPETMFILAFTSDESQVVWSPIAKALPAEIRIAEVPYGNAGRLRNAISVFDGLAMLRTMGEATQIDPGRPGRGAFAEAIYSDKALETLARGLTPAVQHKLAAQQEFDTSNASGKSMVELARFRLERLAQERFAGLVLDYDGTIVDTDTRLEPPSALLIAQIVRLVEAKIPLGIATGRGGSAGEMLRQVLPASMCLDIVVGYYNGAHIRSLAVDIRDDAPSQNAELLNVEAWIHQEKLMRDEHGMKVGRTQLTVSHASLENVDQFLTSMDSCPYVVQKLVRVTCSHHSVDIVPVRTTKLSVVRALAEKTGRGDAPILTIGDSGGPFGNDNELLSGFYGISVDKVCGSAHGCWSLFGIQETGPAALLRILQAIKIENAEFTLDMAKLEPTLS